MALLLDVSGSVSKILETERLAALRFFYGALRPGDSGLLASFSHVIDISQYLTLRARTGCERRCGRSIRSGRIMPAEYDPHGGTLLYEAIQKDAI